MKTYFADFHIHIGRSQGKPVKMAAAPSLTLDNLLAHAKDQKGLDIVTVIDGVCTGVQKDLEKLITEGRLTAHPNGGYLYDNGLTVILGAEVEVGGPEGGAAHFGCWFGTLDGAHDFSKWLATVQKNVSLSSQRAWTDAFTLQREVKSREGLFIVHHAFTPHKGLYGNCVSEIAKMVDPSMVDALELGLSADSDMADCLSELADFTFITNSDAHSLPKIAREYNAMALSEPSFSAVGEAFHRKNGNSVAANYGLEPRLGKYHRTYCKDCERLWDEGAEACQCGSTRRVQGVYDRLLMVRDRVEPEHPIHRPPYIHQVPLEFVPGLGPKLRSRLFDRFGTEMAILHRASVEDIAEVVGETLALRIDQARKGELTIQSGGGGVYGKVVTEPAKSR